MRVAPFTAVLLLAIAAVSWSCGDEDDDSNITPTPPLQASATTAAGTGTAIPAGTATVEAGIVIEEPAAGDVRVPVVMSGRANVFEGALTIDALDNTGNVLCVRHIQASSGSGTEGTWSDVLAFPPPAADAPATLRAYTFSAENGAMEGVVERDVTLTRDRPDIVITSPSCAQEVAAATLTVTGMAQVFEAALSVDIRHSSGVVMTQNVLAASGTEFSPWTATFDLSGLAPGFYDVVAYSHSAMDGSIQDQFPIQISVSP